MTAPAVVAIKVLLRCGLFFRGRLCNRELMRVPPEILDKGIEIECPRCKGVNIFD